MANTPQQVIGNQGGQNYYVGGTSIASNPSATSTVTSTPNAQSFINNQMAGSGNTTTTATAGYTPTPTTTSNSIPKSAYLDFLRKQFNANDLDAANKSLTELNKRTSEELLRARKDEDTIRENKIGQVESGLNYSLNESARKSNRSLADLALAKGYASDTYNRMIGAGKSVYEAEEAYRKEAEERGIRTLEQSASAMAEELKALPDKISQDNYIRTKAAELGVSIDQVNSALKAIFDKPREGMTSAIQEYEYAKQSGFKGSFQQWLDRPSQYKGTGGGGTTASLKADINADVAGLISKWNNGYIQGNGTISSKDYKAEKARWIQAYAGDVADPGKQFDDLFGYLADQSGYDWQKAYGIR